MSLTKVKKSQSGFTLLEMAISIVIFGFILSMGLVMMTNYARVGKERAALNTFEVVADAISLYAQSNYRIPCPSTSNVASANFGRDTIGDDCTGNTVGIIPFRTLGLSEEYIRDGFGRFITYAVSPAATLDSQRVDWNTIPIGNWCMTSPNWFQDTDGDLTSDDFINIPKAGFCCGNLQGAIATDIQVLGQDGLSVFPNRQVPNFGGSAPEYMTAAAVTPPAAPALAGTFPPSYIAYVLVSHGENGNGAYTETGGRAPDGTAAETENNPANQSFYATGRINPAGPTVDLDRQQIDDLVFWQSSAQVMSRFGGISCNRP